MIKRILFSILTIILIIGMGGYLYSLLENKRTKTPENLFSLIPQSAFAVWETENLYDVVSTLRKPSYNTHYDSLGISDLLTFLINNIEEISHEEGHRNNPYVKELLVSFHEPHSSRDQILYLKTEETRRNQLEKYIRKLSLKDFPPKTFHYRNEDIIIYPLKDNKFIACYYHPSFLAVSYQAKLVEEVIDTYLDNTSILSDSIFTLAMENKKGHSESTLYLRTYPLPFQQAETRISSLNEVGQWVEFDIITNRDAIYLAGSSFAPDSMETFSKTMQLQQPVKLPSSQSLPESTFMFSQLALSDLGKVASQISHKTYPIEQCSDFIERADSAMFVFLQENADNTICNFIFHSLTEEIPFSTLIHIPLKDRKKAENNFRPLQLNWTKEERNNRYIYPRYYWGKNSYYSIYELPAFPLLHHFRTNTVTDIPTYYGCFYQNELLISPDYNSLSNYIQSLEKETTKENDLLYQECISGLAPESNVLLFTDLRQIIEHQEYFNHIIPGIFLENPEFFKHFILTVQYSLNKDKLSPNISLIYKGEELL